MNVMTTAVTNFGNDLVTGDLAVNGAISAGGSVTGTTGLTATTGNITAQAGGVSASGTVTGSSGLVSLGTSSTAAYVTLNTSGFQRYTISSTNGTNVTGANNLEFYNQTNTTTVMKITDTGSMTIPSSFTSTSGGIFATTGDIKAQLGSISAAGTGANGKISASGTVTGGTGLIATTGNITAQAGGVSASGTVTGGTGLIATTGNITAQAGGVSASGTVTGGTGLIATTGGVTASAGNIVATAGNIVASAGTVTGVGLTSTSGGVTLYGTFPNVNFLVGPTTWNIVPSVASLTFINNNSPTTYVFFDTAGNVHGTAFTPTSDYRLKSNIAPLNDSLSIIQALRPVNYTLNVDPSNIESGFIAHELQEVLPGAVKGVKDGPAMQAINPVHIIAHLVGAVQELTKRLEQLSG